MEIPLSRRSRKPNRKTKGKKPRNSGAVFASEKSTFRTSMIHILVFFCFFCCVVFSTCALSKPFAFLFAFLCFMKKQLEDLQGLCDGCPSNPKAWSIAFLDFNESDFNVKFPHPRSLDHSSITDEEANNAAAWYHRPMLIQKSRKKGVGRYIPIWC